MNKQLLSQLEKITKEEESYLNGKSIVDKNIYTQDKSFNIDPAKFLCENKLITVRTHTRFIDFPVHKHNYVEIMYVCQGTITHCINGKEIEMHQGDFLLLNQQVEHSVKCARQEDIGINFIALSEFFDIPRQMLKEPNILAEFLMNIFQSRQQEAQYLLFRLGCQKQIENIIENMIYSIKNKNSNEELINQYYMGIIFLYLVNHIDTVQQNSSKNYREIAVEATLNYIESHYRTASLQKVADDFNLSESALSKIIKQCTGKTFQEHLMIKRFESAKTMLKKTSIPIEEISINIGYENFSFFYRKFKEFFGETPRSYRQQNKSTDGK